MGRRRSASQRRTVPSSPPLARVWLSGLNATAVTSPWWPASDGLSGRRARASQICSRPLAPPTASVPPVRAGCHPIDGGVARRAPSARARRASHSRTLPSMPAEASVPFRVKATPRTQPRWPWSGRLRGCPARVSHSWIAPDRSALAKIPPRGLNATALTPAPPPPGEPPASPCRPPARRGGGEWPRSTVARSRHRCRWPAWCHLG